MKKSKIQSKNMNCNRVNDCKKDVSNKSNNKTNDKSELGFSNETRSFELDRNDEHSFELK